MDGITTCISKLLHDIHFVLIISALRPLNLYMRYFDFTHMAVVSLAKPGLASPPIGLYMLVEFI